MLAQFYHPDTGGEERHVQDLSLALVERGHEVAVATLWRDGLAPFESDHGVRIYRLPSTVHRAEWLFSKDPRKHAPPFPDPETTRALHKLIEKERPGIVHAHNWMIYSFLPLKQKSRARLVVTLHDYSLGCAIKRLMYQGSPCKGPALSKCLGCAREHYGLVKGPPVVLANRVMSVVEKKNVDQFITVSSALISGNQLSGSGVPVQVIPNLIPLDANGASPDLDSRLADLPKEYMLFVGDLSRDKGIEILLDAYRGLQNAPALVLIGRRCDHTPERFPKNVHYMGTWPHAAVMAAWQKACLGLVPSLWQEPFGVVAIEAMASGKPVIAANTGGLSDIIIDGETGLLVPPGESRALRKAMERLIADKTLRERMGRAARARAAGYQADQVVAQIEQVYFSLLERNRAEETLV